MSLKVIFLGTSGFPKGMAAIEKQRLLSKALINSGCEVKVICNTGIHKERTINRKGEIEGIKYNYTSFTTYRINNFFLRRASAIWGKIYELLLLFLIPSDVYLVLNRNIFRIFSYKVLAVIKRSKVILISHEETSLERIKKFTIRWFNNVLFNKYAWRIVDAAMPITSVLEQDVMKSNDKLPSLIVPAIADFDFIDSIIPNKKKSDDYILFCGAAGYLYLMEFIIDSFEHVKNNCKLRLISNGTETQMNMLYDKVKLSKKHDKIEVLSNLSYNDLIIEYKSSKALLIPLTNTNQDIARFPHKIAEYSACKVPIISTNYGVPSKYFVHKVSALLASDFDKVEFAKMIDYVFNNNEGSINIGMKAYEIGRREFYYKTFGDKIMLFIKMNLL